jgi:ornithine cyclodeaminase/alanine dehydrogenase-like protein (mu-crystallin family)
MSIPVFSRDAVLEAVSPQDAYAAVRNAFIAHHRGEWVMQPKIYVTNYPAGDFRAMPAIGGGHALLKWVTSFPGNPALGLPTVTGLVVLSNSETGQLEAVLDAASVTALRTAAAGVLAADTLGVENGPSVAVVGCGVNGAETVRMLVAHGRTPVVWDADEARRRFVADQFGAEVAGSLDEALARDAVVTITPGRDVLFSEGSLRPGQHVSLMGADGPGKAEIATRELGRARLFCDDWEQASHGGELAAGVAAGLLARDDVTELGAVLAGAAEGRVDGDDVTLFDSTGLAIQDLAIARAALLRSVEMDLPRLEL